MFLISLNPLKTPNEGVFKAEFSDGSSLLLSVDYLCPEKNSPLPVPGTEFSPIDEENFRFAAACYRAEKTALRLITRAEQNSTALTFKLEHRGYDFAAVKKVIASLSGRNLLDDRRYAERWLRSRLAGGKPQSPRWLLASLGKRGISRDSCREALNTVLDPDTEYTLLSRYLAKKKMPEDEKTAYLKRNLKYEGFSHETIDRYFDTF